MYGNTMYTLKGASFPLPRRKRKGRRKPDRETEAVAEQKLTSHNEHVKYIDDAWMLQGLEYFDFPQGRDGHALLLVVHQDPLQCDMAALHLVYRLVYLTVFVHSISQCTPRSKSRIIYPKVPSPNFVVTS